MKITVRIENEIGDEWDHTAEATVDSPREELGEVFEDALGALYGALVAAGFSPAGVAEIVEGMNA